MTERDIGGFMHIVIRLTSKKNVEDNYKVGTERNVALYSYKRGHSREYYIDYLQVECAPHCMHTPPEGGVITLNN